MVKARQQNLTKYVDQFSSLSIWMTSSSTAHLDELVKHLKLALTALVDADLILNTEIPSWHISTCNGYTPESQTLETSKRAQMVLRQGPARLQQPFRDPVARYDFISSRTSPKAR